MARNKSDYRATKAAIGLGLSMTYAALAAKGWCTDADFRPEVEALRQLSGRPVAVTPVAKKVHESIPSANKRVKRNYLNELRRCSNPLVKSALGVYRLNDDKPYVWGAESPKNYSETLKDPFFEGFLEQVTERQPPGNWRAGKETEPGFDCSGFVWYAGKRAGLKPFTDRRDTAQGYYNSATKILKPGRYKPSDIKEKARPGDILFGFSEGKACHMAIYGESGLLLECSGWEEPDYDGIPQSEWQRWRGKYGKPDEDRGGPRIIPLEDFRYTETALGRYK